MKVGDRVKWYVYGHKRTGIVESRFSSRSFIVRRDKLNTTQQYERDLVGGVRLLKTG